VANASITILENPKEHLGEIYSLTGSESLSHGQFAKIFSSILETKVTNISPSNEEYKATLLSYNLPQELVDFMGSLYKGIEDGEYTSITKDYELITGEKPITAKEFIEINRSVFIN